MRIERYLGDNAGLRGDKTALVAGGRRFTYAGLDDLSDRLAVALRDAGVKRDDRVLVFMDNCWEAAVAIFATLKAGATFSPINASTKADKLAYIVGDCEPAAVLTQAKLAPVALEARAMAGADGLFIASTAARQLAPLATWSSPFASIVPSNVPRIRAVESKRMSPLMCVSAPITVVVFGSAIGKSSWGSEARARDCRGTGGRV